MKALVLFALVATAAAWPEFGFERSTGSQTSSGGESLAKRQRDINHLLHKVYEPLRDERLKAFSSTFNPEAELSHYDDGGAAVQKLMRELKAERLQKKGRIMTALTPRDLKEALMLFEVLLYCKDWETVIANAAYFREQMNEEQFVYAVYAAVKHIPIFEQVVLPPLYEIVPHFYTNNTLILETYKAKMTGIPVKLNMNFTGTKKNPERQVAYFAEDIGLSTHYANWHIEYPFWWNDTFGRHIERKGEIFFWIHHQLTNRFDAERISNHLKISEPLWVNEPLKEGFAPQISYKNGVPFPSRPDNMMLVDVEGLPMIHELVHYENRILDAIDHGYIIAKNGSVIDIKNERGIAILGDMIESSLYSPNREFYGSLKNMAHKVIARQADPQGKYGMPPSVMEHYMAAIRDPSFYKLHKRIDNLFRKHKDSLPPYTKEELVFPGVAINSVAIDGPLETYLEDYEFSLVNVFEDKIDTEVKVSTIIPRLRHKDFGFNINVLNNNKEKVMATVRIMAWPHRYATGAQLSFNEGRWHAIELDKFWVPLTPGENHIVRKSSDASVTVPDVPSFKTLMRKTEEAVAAGTDLHLHQFESATGLPNRLLIPKGNKAGVEFILVVAVTDGAADAAIEGLPNMTKFHYYDVKGVSPDKKPFGYPLDRRIPEEHVFHEIPNIKETIVKVYNHGEHIRHE